MFSTLFAAKKAGVIAFDWEGPLVIVTGVDAFGRSEILGVGTEDPDILLRPFIERDLAIRLGVVSMPLTTWEPEEL
jgi:hypothetical protein